MSNKYFKASEYYPDDKDIYDFLDSQTRSNDHLMTYLRNRGIFVSKNEPKEDLQRYVSLLYFDWRSAVQLVNMIDLRETEDKLANRKVSIPSTQEHLDEALRRVQNMRQVPNREVYQLRRTETGIIVDVKYIDVDTSKSRVLQKRERELEIRIDDNNGELSIRHTDCAKAKSIVENVLGELMDVVNVKVLPQTYIELKSIKEHRKRLMFFIKLMREIPGFKLINVSNLKIEKMPRQEDEKSKDMDEEELRDKLKRAVLIGDQLLLAREFQEFSDRGFFISSATWLSEKDGGYGPQVEFHAGFNDPSEADEFSYKVMGEYEKDENGEFFKQRKKVEGSAKRNYLEALESSAFAAKTSLADGS